jgi:DNA-binding GntR family transcriptional regulator
MPAAQHSPGKAGAASGARPRGSSRSRAAVGAKNPREAASRPAASTTESPPPVLRALGGRTRAPLREEVRDELREAIIGGALAPGVRLIERELIEMLGVSRTVIREALRQLESEGLITTDARKGMVVRELTMSEATHLYAIRALLEGLAARLFVENATPDDRQRLRAALNDTVEAYERGDPRTILDTKNRFYRCLYDGAQSDALSSMLDILHARIWRWRFLGLRHPQRSGRRSRESVRGLEALIAAINKGDAERAEAVMREETTRAAAEVMRLLSLSTAG